MSGSTTFKANDPALPAQAPIGIFDSGLGGLSVLRDIRALLPHEALIYLADQAYLPYGDKTQQEIRERAFAITEFFLTQGCKAIVIACNTATAAAIKDLRAAFPDFPFIGVEPGLRPAAKLTQTRQVGVLATLATSRSEKFLQLQQQLSQEFGVQFHVSACVGLVELIEAGKTHHAETQALLRHYLSPLITAGCDTLVLGCTHYPFVRQTLQTILAQPLNQQAGELKNTSWQLIETGSAVAQRLADLLAQNLRLVDPRQHARPAQWLAYTNGDADVFSQSCANLGLAPEYNCRVTAI